MPRPLVIGNGRLLVTLDHDLSLRDLTFPQVGLLNHLSGHYARIGLWADGLFAWLSDAAWRKSLRYLPDTLVTDAAAEHDAFGLRLTVQDTVRHDQDVLLRRFRIENRWDAPREIRLFLSHDFYLNETDIGDTVFYHPYSDTLIHYKRDVYLLMTARTVPTDGGQANGIFQYTTGIKGFRGAEGVWRDAEDGWLSMNPVEQGSVDSVFSVRLPLAPYAAAEIHGWLCAAHDLDSVLALHQGIEAADFDALLATEREVARRYAIRHTEHADTLPAPLGDLLRRSVLTIATNTDRHGAILAANDSDIMETARAHYSYVWPRDGALVAYALDRLGHHGVTQRFYRFCQRVLPKDRAALLHKYGPDGTWGATWHPWITGGVPEIPFQEDGTALVLWSLWKHYECTGDRDFLTELYPTFIAPCADFVAGFRQPETGLPLPSYDLWEERRGVHAYTCGTVYGALAAAANLAELFADGERVKTFQGAAGEVRAGMEKHLWHDGVGRFVRMLTPNPDDPTVYTSDLTMDSALMAVWAFGAFAPDDPRAVATMEQVIGRLTCRTALGGIARYENDYYFRRSDDIERIPGNPWIICTLWAAQWHIARAKTREDCQRGLDLLLWAAQRAMESGLLPEQIHPETGEPLSVSPLTWSHAEFIETTLNYLEKTAALPD